MGNYFRHPGESQRWWRKAVVTEALLQKALSSMQQEQLREEGTGAKEQVLWRDELGGMKWMAIMESKVLGGK